MNSETASLELIDARGGIIPAVLETWEEAPEDPKSVRITLRFDGTEVTAEEADFFSALRALRRRLEPRGLRMRTYGASRDVYPSGMSQSMGCGEKAYRLKMG